MTNAEIAAELGRLNKRLMQLHDQFDDLRRACSPRKSGVEPLGMGRGKPAKQTLKRSRRT